MRARRKRAKWGEETRHAVTWNWGFQVHIPRWLYVLFALLSVFPALVRAQVEVPACVVALVPQNVSITQDGGQIELRVITRTGCPWNVGVDASWLSVSGTGPGPGTIRITFGAASEERRATINVNGQTYTFTQDAQGQAPNASPAPTHAVPGGQPGGCTLVFPGAEELLASILGEGVAKEILVNAPPACTWSAYTGTDWIEIPENASGSGSGAVGLTIPPNRTGLPRTGSITIGGRTFTFTQPPIKACPFIVASSLETTSGGVKGRLQVTTGPDCQWTAKATVNWIAVHNGSGTGSGSASFSLSANGTGATREGTLVVGGQPITISQPADSSCAYALGGSSLNLLPSGQGAAGSVQVTSPSGCGWAATAGGWITITSGATGSGNGTVLFAASVNPGNARAGAITIAGQTHSVIQPGSTSCTYEHSGLALLLELLGQGGTGDVFVKAPLPCPWTVTGAPGWITVNKPSEQQGNGTVTLSVAANLTGAERTGTLSIAGQTYTVKQTGMPGCGYELETSTLNMGATASRTAIEIKTGANCPWEVSSDADWVAVGPVRSGTGPATVPVSIASNSSGSVRTAQVTAAGRKAVIVQKSAAGQSPAIESAGNAADPTSRLVAPGSLLSITGTGFGPGAPMRPFNLVPRIEVAGVSVTVTQNETSWRAGLLLVSSTRVVAVVPSGLAPGRARVTVTLNGQAGNAAEITVAPSAFAAFSAAEGRGQAVLYNQIANAGWTLNDRSHPAQPGQIVTLWGTGLGTATTESTQVTVGGLRARTIEAATLSCCAGLDKVVFKVPDEAAHGCFVPVQIRGGGGTFSNTVTLAIGDADQPCVDPLNQLPDLAVPGRRSGLILLVRDSISLKLPFLPTGNSMADQALARFFEAGPAAFNPFIHLPPLNTCAAYRGSLRPGEIEGTAAIWSELAAGKIGRDLDAGTALAITGPNKSSISIPGNTYNGKSSSPYWAVLGGNLPIPGLTSSAPYFDGGAYTITGPGGADVGPFSVTTVLEAPVEWTNRDNLASVDRGAGVKLEWSGGAEQRQIMIVGVSLDPFSQTAGQFYCYVPSAPGSFNIPAAVLESLPPSTAGVLALGAIPAQKIAQFTADGLDVGAVLSVSFTARTIPFK